MITQSSESADVTKKYPMTFRMVRLPYLQTEDHR